MTRLAFLTWVAWSRMMLALAGLIEGPAPENRLDGPFPWKTTHQDRV